MNIDQIKADSVGKWPGIFERLGIDVGTGKHKPCPICGGKDRYRFDNKNGNGGWICAQCGAGDGFSLVQKVKSIDFKEACKLVRDLIGTIDPLPTAKERKVTPEYMRKIFKESSKTVEGDAVWCYLKNRGLKTIPNNIRTHMKCHEPETGINQIAMLAIFHDPAGQAITMHRTYIKDGHKMKLLSPKKILPPLKKMAGGSVRLFEPVNGYIGIAEGIETAIAVHDSLAIPVWAALSSTLLETWAPPKGIKKVTVFGDSDKNYTGQKAAYTLANKLAINNKIDVDVELPKVMGTDFLDEINEASKWQKKKQ